MVLESQLPHKTVNLLFHLVIVNNKLTILWGGWLSKNHVINTLCEEKRALPTETKVESGDVAKQKWNLC